VDLSQRRAVTCPLGEIAAQQSVVIANNNYFARIAAASIQILVAI